ASGAAMTASRETSILKSRRRRPPLPYRRLADGLCARPMRKAASWPLSGNAASVPAPFGRGAGRPAQIEPSPPAGLASNRRSDLGEGMALFRRYIPAQTGEELAQAKGLGSKGGRIASVFSAVALALSVYSLWESTLKPADLRVFVPPVIQY